MIPTAVSKIDISGLITAMSGSVGPGDVVTMIGAIVAAGMGFVLVWFGARKGVKAFQDALRTGKIKL